MEYEENDGGCSYWMHDNGWVHQTTRLKLWKYSPKCNVFESVLLLCCLNLSCLCSVVFYLDILLS